MRYTVRVSYIDVIGLIWQPGIACSMRYTLSSYDLENIQQLGDGAITRDAIDQWLSTHSGDFQSVTDWRASIEVDRKGKPVTISYDWEQGEDSEEQYLNTFTGDGE